MASFAYVPVSAWTGMNLLEHDAVNCAWWTGSEVVNSAKQTKLCR
jgi:translation elongation factor EF-1alpha